MSNNISITTKMLIYSAFVISGVAGLIYESVWSHYLGLFLGHAAYAQTLTLAIFMGGMSIGAWVVSKNISKFKNALYIYVIIEFILGIFGLFFHTIFENVIDFSFSYLFPLINDPFGINILKWFIASLLILPQSILLGSTFPLISSGLIRRTKISEGKTISILYFTNSIGAAFGALISTFILLPSMGMPGALMVAATLNIFVALMVYIPSKAKEDKYLNKLQFQPQSNKQEINISYNSILLIAAITGFASFIYEITWIRMLNLVLGTTLHSFEIMLSAFIFGLAMGGFWIKNRIDNIKNIVKYLGVIQVVMGTMALLTMPLYLESFSWVSNILLSVLKLTPTGYTFYNIFTGILAIIVMIPAAFCAGMTFPILTNILFKKGAGEQAIGTVYASNTIGSLIGIWFAIHIGMVVLGLKYMLIFAASVDALVGIILIIKSTKDVKIFLKNKVLYALSIIYVTLVILIITNANFSPNKLASGTYRTWKSELSNSVSNLFYEDGKSASISVMSQMIKNNEIRIIATNGKPDAGLYMEGSIISSDEPTMVLLASIPLLIKPEAKRIANIGFGSGMTTHTMLSSNNIIKIDTIEIEKEIIEGAKYFKPRNIRAYNDPRSNIVIDDAKTFFASNNNKYDIIVSEPSNPWVLGVGNLFSKEFYHNIKRYLKEDGMLVQWIQLYEIRPQVLSSAINALASEFDHYEAYLSNSIDLIIIASNKKIENISYNNISEIDKGLRADLSRIGINNIESINARKIGSKESLFKYFNGFSRAINSDYFPILSLEAPKDRFMKISSKNIFNYANFNVPVFELIGTQNDINKILMENSFDDHHPFAAKIKNQMDFFEFFENIEEYMKPVEKYSYGLSHVFKNEKSFCGKSPELESKWLDSYISIYDGGVALGFNKLKDIVQLPSITECSHLAMEPSTKWVIAAFKLFAERKHSEFISFVSSQINVTILDNVRIKRSLINKALFSLIKLEKDKIKKDDYLEIMTANKTVAFDNATFWLISFL